MLSSLDYLLAIEGEVDLSLPLDLVCSKIGNICSKTELDSSASAGELTGAHVA